MTPFENLSLPFVQATSQEGAISRGGDLESSLLSHEKMFEKIGKLQVKHMLMIEPDIYLKMEDLTMSDYKGGKIYQISELEMRQNDKQIFQQSDQVV